VSCLIADLVCTRRRSCLRVPDESCITSTASPVARGVCYDAFPPQVFLSIHADYGCTPHGVGGREMRRKYEALVRIENMISRAERQVAQLVAAATKPTPW
jgi:hypothetical protein